MFRYRSNLLLLDLSLVALLGASLLRTERVLHPPVSIGLTRAIAFMLLFAPIAILCAFAASQLSSWLYARTNSYE
jgi:hypothetical protein